MADNEFYKENENLFTVPDELLGALYGGKDQNRSNINTGKEYVTGTTKYDGRHGLYIDYVTGLELYEHNSTLFDKGGYVGQALDSMSSNDDAVFENIIDRDWVMSRFMVPGTQLEPLDKLNRFFSTAYWKYTNSSLGGNIAINPKPQYTRYADIRHPNRWNTQSEVTIDNPLDTMGKSNNTNGFMSPGLGRYYSEAIDDNAQLIHMQFGVPKFNNIFSFFTYAVDYNLSVIANRGMPPNAYKVARYAGTGLLLWMFPLVGTSLLLGKKLGETFGLFNSELSRYYYFKPTMMLYWGIVTEIATLMATELGIIWRGIQNKTKEGRIGVPVTTSQADMDGMKKLFPNLITNSNYIDIIAVALRTQALANLALKREQEMTIDLSTLEQGGDGNGDLKAAAAEVFGKGWLVSDPKELASKAASGENQVFQGLDKAFLNFNNGEFALGFQALLDMMNPNSKSDQQESIEVKRNRELYVPEGESNGGNTYEPKLGEGGKEGAISRGESEYGAGQAKKEGFGVIQTDDSGEDGTYGWYSKKGDETANEAVKQNESFIKAVFKDGEIAAKGGASYACFFVDYTGSPSESVSNSVGPISTETGAKSIGKAAQDIRFMVGGDSFLGVNKEYAVQGVVDAVVGTLDGLTLGLSNVLAAIYNGAYIDMPNKWEDSDISFTNVNYTMTLISPYNNPISQMINIYIPLAMLLAGALPRGTGRSSYTSPFICTLWDRGVQDIKLGMITNISINRATSNLPWSKDRKALAMEVSFTVANLSTYMVATINGSVFGTFRPVIVEDDPLSIYIATICGRDFKTNNFYGPKMRLKLSRVIMGASYTFSRTAWAARAGKFVDDLTLGTIESTGLMLSGAIGRSW